MELSGEVVEQLEKLRHRRMLIVGVGNTLKGDDGVGPLVCQKLEGKVRSGVLDAGTVPENYIQQIVSKAPEGLLVVDAMYFVAKPGAVMVFQPEQLGSMAWSTHTMSPRFFVEMVRGAIEVETLFLGIQPKQCRFREGLSAEIEAAAGSVAEVLVGLWGI